jgi:RimJ/RimL family protein N-acetyltransferase
MKSSLRTPRLDLRVFTMDDVDPLHSLFSDPHTHSIGSGAFTDRQQTVRWIENRVTAFQQFGLAWYAVRVTGSETIIGNCGMLVGRKTSDEPEIGYEIAATERGRGFASEAARAVLEECKAARIDRVWATVRPTNSPSLRIVESLGFSRAFSEVDEKGPLLHLSKVL